MLYSSCLDIEISFRLGIKYVFLISHCVLNRRHGSSFDLSEVQITLKYLSNEFLPYVLAPWRRFNEGTFEPSNLIFCKYGFGFGTLNTSA